MTRKIALALFVEIGVLSFSFAANATIIGANVSTNALTLTAPLSIANGGSGQADKMDAFNAFSPLVLKGDLLVDNGSTSTALHVGSDGQVLVASSTVAAGVAWETVGGGGGGGGTVTSVNGSGGSTGLTFTGGPVTSTGVLTLGGTLGITNGGTGRTTAIGAFNALSPLTTRGDVLYFDGTSNARLAAGTPGQFLETQGAGANPVWATVGGGSGTVTSVTVSGGSTGLTFSGGAITSAATTTLSGVLSIANGGTGASDTNTALNALLPMQPTHNGQVLTTDGTNVSWQADVDGGGGGGVTSFSAGNLSPLFNTSVGTPGSTPALSFSLLSAAPLSVFAGPNAAGPSAPPTFRALVAADIPNLDASQITSGTLPGSVQSSITALGTVAAGTWHGSTIDVTHGGTGVSTFATNGIPFGNGTSGLNVTASADNGVLVTDAGGTPSISSTLPTAVQSGITQLGTLTTSVTTTGQFVGSYADITASAIALTPISKYVNNVSVVPTPNDEIQLPDATTLSGEMITVVDSSANPINLCTIPGNFLNGNNGDCAEGTPIIVNAHTMINCSVNSQPGWWCSLASGVTTVNGSGGGLTLTGSGSPGVTLALSGTLDVANGGTGATTFTPNGILFGNGNSALNATGSGNNGVLVTDAGGAPSISSTLPSAVQSNITQLGILTTSVTTTGQFIGSHATVPAYDSGGSPLCFQFQAALALVGNSVNNVTEAADHECVGLPVATSDLVGETITIINSSAFLLDIYPDGPGTPGAGEYLNAAQDTVKTVTGGSMTTCAAYAVGHWWCSTGS